MRRIVNKMVRIVNKIERIVNKMRRIVNKMGRIVNKTLTSILILNIFFMYSIYKIYIEKTFLRESLTNYTIYINMKNA